MTQNTPPLLKLLLTAVEESEGFSSYREKMRLKSKISSIYYDNVTSLDKDVTIMRPDLLTSDAEDLIKYHLAYMISETLAEEFCVYEKRKHQYSAGILVLKKPQS